MSVYRKSENVSGKHPDNDLSDQQKGIFKWRSDIVNFDLSQVYRQYFADNEFIFSPFVGYYFCHLI
jgi:hypothetical protein